MKLNTIVIILTFIFIFTSCSQYSEDDLHQAIKQNDIKRLKQILDAGIDVDAANQDNQSPLMVAAYLGNIDVLKLLLKSGASINLTDETGRSPLIYAISGGKIKSVSELLYQGANVNQTDAKGNSPLHYAAKLNNHSIVSLLLSNGADSEIANKKGRTALMIAGRNEQQENIRAILVHLGTDEDETFYDHTLIKMISKRDFKTVKAIFREIGANRNVSYNGRTALMEAAYQGDIRIAKFLLNYPVENIDFFEMNGLTALGEATLQGHIDVVELLLNHGASPNAGTTSAIQLAETANRADLIEILTRDR